ncbi:hypothetical protein CALVIDRAFT_598619 [Calocera viscosa TUFC12733]|uniref:Carbohydrate-binding module family 12 protein n=1 Tax=Calocera viscosa (strain TUFC12733) TaxID=1330018 RepID=A0A167LPW2_CALVF|nr:hypothetical protein CALVIDRAFT_598619 [Calocera viscosa TUFC12733]
MPPFEHLHTGAPYPPPHSAHTSTWQPSTWYDTGSLVLFEQVTYRSTGGHLSGESWTPDRASATWIPLEKSKPPAPVSRNDEKEKSPESLESVDALTKQDDAQQPQPPCPTPAVPENEPPPTYPQTPTHVDQAVQTDITFPPSPSASFPPWVFNTWPMPYTSPSGSFGSHALQMPWLPPFQPNFHFPTGATGANETQLPLPPQYPAPGREQPTIHAPMPLHLPLRLPPALESVLAPISDPLDTRYRAARAAERSQQSSAGFRAEVAGERVVRSHGCGVWAFGGARERGMEEEREAAWRESGARGPEAWLRAARARRAAYAVPGAVRPPVRWVLVDEGQKIPADALQTGVEATGEPLFSTRVWWKGGLHLGKAANHIYNYASISWDSQEHTTPTFEVLCGAPLHVQWLEIPHGTRATAQLMHDLTAVEGGREANGTFIFVAQGEYGLGGGSGLHPGKASAGDDHACIGYGGGEVWIRPFRIMVYVQSSMG